LIGLTSFGHNKLPVRPSGHRMWDMWCGVEGESPFGAEHGFVVSSEVRAIAFLGLIGRALSGRLHMLRPRRGWLTLVLCAPIWVAAPLRAQPTEVPAAPSNEQATDQARQLFNEGLGFVEQEDWAQAEDRFRHVLALRSSHVVSYNLASALTHLGRLVESSELLRAIVRDSSADATTHDAATQLLSEIEARIGTLTIRLLGDADGASVSLDDKPLELSGQVQTTAVDPGEHRVVVQRDGVGVAQKSVTVGDPAPLQVEIALELPPRVAPGAAAQTMTGANTQPERSSQAIAERGLPERESRSVLSRWWFWAGVGALVAGGVVTALIAAPSAKATPVAGDTDPPVIHGRVAAAMP
jgi:hypothetical protein